jgi:uncharacterized linocin/CFP29 family protein
MATSARDLVGWTEQRWTAVEEAARKALARTAKCRQVIPIGAEQIGAKGVVISTIAAGTPIAYGPDRVASPIQIFVNATLSDQNADDEGAIFRLVESAAAQLGFVEDQEVIQGPPPVPAAPVAAVAPVPAPQQGRLPRTPGLPPRERLNEIFEPKDKDGSAFAGAQRFETSTAIPILPPGVVPKAPGGAPKAPRTPTAAEIVAAVRTAQGELETAGRPGPCGLLLHSRLFATLGDLAPGGAPYLQQVEQCIDSSEIAGTSALDGSNDARQVCGILFRLEPPALDLVQTARPTVTVLGRAGGQTELRVEEDLVIRILDRLAIHHIYIKY